MRNLNLLLFSLIFLPSFRVKAQCLDSEGFYKQLSEHSSYSNNKLIIKEVEKLKRLYEKCHPVNDSVYAKIVHVLGRSYWYSGELDKAIFYVKKAIAVNSLKQPSTKEANLCHSYFNLGKIYIVKNDYQRAIKAFEACIKIAVQYPEKYFSGADAYVQIANLYFEIGDYEKTVSESQKGYLLAQKALNSNLMVQNLNEKGQGLLAQNNLAEAESVFNTSLTIAQQAPNFSAQSFIYSKLASISKTKKQSQAVINYYQKALKINKDAHFNYGIVENLVNLGYFYRSTMKEYEKALDYYKKAIEETKNTEDNSLKLRIYNNIGYVFFLQRKHREGLQYYQKGLNIALAHFADNRIEINPIAKTIELVYFKEYLLTLIQDKADTWLSYSKTPIGGKGALQNALKTYALADSMIDFMRYEHAGEGSKLFWRQKTRGMYERAIEASYLAGDTEAAFRFFEKSKAVLLADKLNELGANQQLSKADTKRQRMLRDSITNLQNQLSTLSANDKKRQPLQTRLERYNDAFETFRKNLEQTNPAYYRYKYDNSTPSIREFQSASLGDKRAFVSYFVGDSAVYAFTITSQQTKVIKLKISPAIYQSTANEFLNLCADRGVLNAQYPRYQTLAYALYEQLWQPLAITSKHVIISSDGVFLPFEALLSTPSGNEFLLKRHAISYTYSAGYLKPPVHRWGNFNNNSFVGFAPETFQPSLRQASLKGSVAALEEVGDNFWWGKLLNNTEATKVNFLRYAPNARVIQLFTHADADSTEANEPKIYFQDAALRLSELNQADRFEAQLLVLSACKTGIGQNQRGEGVFSLARGFAALGILSTITTLWSVEDQPTYKLTKLFYSHLDQGLPKDEALQHAKLDWLAQSDAAGALPSQWAGMILVGETAPLSNNRLPFGVYGLGLVGLGLLGGAWWWRRKRKAAPL